VGARSHAFAAALSVTVLGAILVVGLALVIPPEKYSALAAGVQAVGVLAALAVAAAAIRSDSQGRRLDRVLALHEQLNAGELQEVGGRLVDHMKEHGEAGKLRRLTMTDLRNESSPLHRYGHHGPDERPSRDAARMLGFFDRVNAARQARVVDEELLFELLGGSAMWWDLALTMTDEYRKVGLSELAHWAHRYASVARERSRVDRWANNRLGDFDILGPVPRPVTG
jgi:hypothetical protein